MKKQTLKKSFRTDNIQIELFNLFVSCKFLKLIVTILYWTRIEYLEAFRGAILDKKLNHIKYARKKPHQNRPGSKTV